MIEYGIGKRVPCFSKSMPLRWRGLSSPVRCCGVLACAAPTCVASNCVEPTWWTLTSERQTWKMRG